MQVQTALFEESPEQIFARVFRELKPRTPLPPIRVVYRRFANANSFIRLRDGRIEARVSDVIASAPGVVKEALAYILIGKLYRREIPPAYEASYRMYLASPAVRGELHEMRRERGRKYVSGPQGSWYDLAAMFDDLNARFFSGSLATPRLGWSRKPSRSLLGHYDAAHGAVILSKLLDDPRAPRLCVEYVLYHEMLHLKHPVEHRGTRRCVHTQEFKAEERRFPGYERAKKLLRLL